MSNNYFFSSVLLPEGWAHNVRVQICNGYIEEVFRDAMAIDGDRCYEVVIPAMPNCHSHVFQRLMAGQAEYRVNQQDDFWSWRSTMYKLANTIRVDQMYDIAKSTYQRMRQSGYSSVCEFHYLHRDLDNLSDYCGFSEAIIHAANDANIDLTLLPVLYAYSGIKQQPLLQEQKRFELSVKEYLHLYEKMNKQLQPRQAMGVCFHSIRAVDQWQIDTILKQIDRTVPVHIHIAEQSGEVEDCLKHYGKRPVEWLFNEFDVGSNWCLVHATHIDGKERKNIAASGAVVGLCPVTEANLGDGVFPLSDYLCDSGLFAIGSDSNIRISPAAEIELLEYGQRLQLGKRVVGTDSRQPHNGSFLWQHAVSGGAQISGLPVQGIRVGQRSAMIALKVGDLPTPDSAEMYLDQWIFSDQIEHQIIE